MAIADVTKEYPLLVSHRKDVTFKFKNYWFFGWLIQDESSWMWLVWGASKTLADAESCARRVLAKQGPRPVFVSRTALENGRIYEGIHPQFSDLFKAYRPDRQLT